MLCMLHIPLCSSVSMDSIQLLHALWFDTITNCEYTLSEEYKKLSSECYMMHTCFICCLLSLRIYLYIMKE